MSKGIFESIRQIFSGAADALEQTTKLAGESAKTGRSLLIPVRVEALAEAKAAAVQAGYKDLQAFKEDEDAMLM